MLTASSPSFSKQVLIRSRCKKLAAGLVVIIILAFGECVELLTFRFVQTLISISAGMEFI